MKFFIIAGAINGFLAVALGAFGAHLLEGRIADKYLSTWGTAVQYQMFHALALVAIGILMSSKVLGHVSAIEHSGLFNISWDCYFFWKFICTELNWN